MGNLDELAENTARDERTRKAIKILASKYDEKYKEYLLWVYSDPKLRSLYNSMRMAYEVDKNLKDTKRLVVKYPNMIVYKFLDDVFKPKYGDNWATDKEVLAKVLKKEDLIQPWRILGI